MSKIGKMPVELPEGVTVVLDNNKIQVTGSKGNLSFVIPVGIGVSQQEKNIIVAPKGTGQEVNALFGLTRAIIANMVKGVSIGFEKKLELSGVGYRAQVNGTELVLSVGFSHPVKFQAQDGIKFTVVDNAILVSGIDKALVGDTAAKIRAVRPPEPYKGKGIKYAGERVRRKAGKAAKAVGGK